MQEERVDEPEDDYDEHPDMGRRRGFVLTVLSDRSSLPKVSFAAKDALFRQSPSLAYTAALSEPPNEFGWSEIAWANVAEIRLWGAIAFSIREGRGFYSFSPLVSRRVWAVEMDEERIDGIAQRLARENPPQSHELHSVVPSVDEIGRLYDVLLHADNVLLRGVSCYLKSHVIWRLDRVTSCLLAEEMAFNLCIALEAGLTTLRKRLRGSDGGPASYAQVFQFIARTFAYGEPLVEYWQDCHDDRNSLLHPDSDMGAYVMHPMSVDDIWELFDPMLSLYRYILIGEPRPTS
jgi:hypothetical protein